MRGRSSAFVDRADQCEVRDVDRPRRSSLDEAHHRRGGELGTSSLTRIVAV
jgi:hypothetical protein